MFLSTGLKRVRLLGMGTHFFPKNLARGMLIRVGTFIRDTIVHYLYRLDIVRLAHEPTMLTSTP